MNPTSAYPESSTQNYSESRYSIATTSSLTNASFEGRRGPARPDKKNQFTYKNGRKYHAYGPEKAPYPMSYDREVIDIDIVDHHVRTKLHHTPTVMDAIETPRRVLDLGCGTGIWSIEAARAWPETEFVGFDLVNIQISLSCLEPSVARRISWQHGNFLSTKLPFEDDSFDHVHIIGIARGVPENKWSSLFEEIHRVLEPDGSVEISEEDIIFPVLPRWFTEPLHAKAQCSSTIQPANGSIHVSIPSPSPLSSPSSQPPHEHALLELLFNSVYESRFINMKPTAVLPVYFTSFFSQCISASPMILRVPFLAPLMPLPEPLAPSQSIESRLERRSSSLARPETPPLTPPSLQSAASSLSLPTSSFSSFSTNNGSDLSMYMSLSLVSDDDDGPDTPTVAHTAATGKSPPKPKMREVDLFGSHRDSASWLSADVDGTKLDSALSRRSSFQKPNLENFSERTRAMSLYRAYIGVLACKEEMWTELKMLRTARLELLSDLGWEKTTSEDQTMEEQDARERFEELFALFESDILTRVSFWYSLTELGYALPRREPLNKSELLEEERMRNAIMDSRAAASEDDFDVPCRILRVFAGFKAYEGEEESFLVDGVE